MASALQHALTTYIKGCTLAQVTVALVGYSKDGAQFVVQRLIG